MQTQKHTSSTRLDLSGSILLKSATLVVALIGGLCVQSRADHHEIPDGVWVRPGYSLTVADSTIQSPRFLQVGPGGVLYVSILSAGEIKACRDKDGDGHFETLTTYVDGYKGKRLQGMAWHDGWLWFSEMQGIYKSRDTNGDDKADDVVQVIGKDQLPIVKDTGHRWRALLIHNNRIYTHIGDPTNATDEPIDAGDRKKLWSFAMDGSDKKLICTGIRNTEKFVIRPGTDEIWGVDHDIDMLAATIEAKTPEFGQPITDHNPPSELNHYVEGGFYGHPYVLGKNIPNFNFLDKPNLVELASKTIIPEWTMASHSSGIGMMFYDGDQIPNAKGDAFVAMRGGWNATQKVGYCLSRILFEYGHPYGEQKMVDFLKDGTEVLGRLVDCVQAPDGSILFTDDTKHKVYRLSYIGE